MKSAPSIPIGLLSLGLHLPVAVDSFTSPSMKESPRTSRLQFQPSSSPSVAPPTSCMNSDALRQRSPTSTSISMAAYSNRYGNGRSSPRYAGQTRTKRQERVGHVVRTELATLLNRDTILRNDNDPIEGELRRRINVVHTDVSPDLRQARVTVSIMGGADRKDDAASKRRAYAWLVRNTKAIRYAMAARMKHMKGGSPELTFVQVDVGAAVDVMALIDKVGKGYKREDVLGMGFDDSEYEEYGYDDDEWEDEEERGEEGDDDDGWFDFDEDGDGISVEVEL